MVDEAAQCATIGETSSSGPTLGAMNLGAGQNWRLAKRRLIVSANLAGDVRDESSSTI